MMIGKPPIAVKSHEWGITNGAAAWVLSLDRKWQPCLVRSGGRFLSIKDRKIEGGMSGSPIIDANGAAIGLISTGSGGGDYYRLIGRKPSWLRMSFTPCGQKIRTADEPVGRS